jgi:hypothetical protein
MTVTVTTPIAALPPQFEDLQAFQDWVEASFPDDATTVDKGRGWRDFLCELIPLTDVGRDYPALVPSEKESNDGGVDAVTEPTDTGRFVAVQARLHVADKIKLDSVISAFEDFERSLDPAEADRLFTVEQPSRPVPVFVVACANPLQRILASYSNSSLGSRRFYDHLQAERRIHILDGAVLLDELRRLWRMSFSVPSEITLTSARGWLTSGDVSLGVVSGADIAHLARAHGFGLFFENVRDFLGLGKRDDRTTVNQAIQATARDEPQKMLARNNGLVFRASAVEPDEPTRLRLHDASIVNGCQTTMCLARLENPVAGDCQVLVKVVCASDAWEVAEAANTQNAIAQIDLKLARFLRKQLASKAAAEAGVKLVNHSEPEGIGKVIAALRREEASYEQLRYLYIGLFSRKPNNLWDDNYERLLEHVLALVYADDSLDEQLVFETLFGVLEASSEALAICARLNQEEDPLRRAHENTRPKYRVYIAMLALCATLEDNLSERSEDSEKEAERMRRFLERAREITEHPQTRQTFVRNFTRAYSVLGEVALEEHEDDAKGRVAQRVQGKLASMSFTTLYAKLRRRIETDDLLKGLGG